MKEIEAEGNTVEEAVKEALERLHVKRDKVEVEVIENGSRGFLGLIGSRRARVRVRVKRGTEETISECLREMIKKMGLELSLEIREEDDYWIGDFYGRDVRLLIGRRGETLNALQMLANMIVNRQLDERIKLVLDAEGYRKRREETLRRLARRLSERVKRSRREVILEPMTPQERRVIHMELQDNPWVCTSSIGEEPYRKVVISLKR